MLPRNAVVMTIDALRADRVGALGGAGGLTPNLDRLADNSVTFRNAFACTNATDPSVTSLHTGRDPMAVVTHHASLVTPEERGRARSVPWLPELLSEQGYRTYATGRFLGRWHGRGFDAFPNSTFDRYRRERIGEALERLSPKLRSVARTVYDRLSDVRAEAQTDDEIDELLSHIDSGSGPFYGYVHSMDTHVPYEPDPELVERLLNERSYPNRDLSTFLEENTGPYFTDFFAGALEPRDFEVGLARLLAKYDAAVIEADRKVGRLIDGLEQRDLLDDTIVVILSDHGESLLEHSIYFDHHGLYDETIHVPMIAHVPHGDASVRDEHVMLKDVPHTILDLLEPDTEAETALGGTGRSFASLLGGRTEQWEDRPFVVAGEAHAQRRLAIRTPRWKYITHIPDPVLDEAGESSARCRYCDTQHETTALFDLSETPDETENVLDGHPERAAELEEQLMEYVDSVDTVVGRTNEVFDDEDEVMKRLDDLGYV